MGYCSYLHGFKEIVLFIDEPKFTGLNRLSFLSFMKTLVVRQISSANNYLCMKPLPWPERN